MRLALYAILSIFLQLTGAAYADSTVSPHTGVDHVVGELVSGFYQVGAIQAPLPPGVWEVSGYRIRRNNVGSRQSMVQLVQFSGGVVVGLVQISLPNQVETDRYAAFPFCEKKHWHFLRKTKNEEGGRQDCFFVDNTVMDPSPKNQADRSTVKYITGKSAKLPRISIYTVHRMASQYGQFLTAWYFFFPALSGFAEEAATTADASKWKAARVIGGTPEKQFVGRVIKWAELSHDKIRRGFVGKLTATDTLPPLSTIYNRARFDLPKPATQVTVPRQPAPLNKPSDEPSSQDDDVERRLGKVKDLLDRGLISEEEAAEKRREILRSL